MKRTDSKGKSEFDVDSEETSEHSTGSTAADKKRKFEDADADSATAMPNDVLIKSPHFITSEWCNYLWFLPYGNVHNHRFLLLNQSTRIFCRMCPCTSSLVSSA
jgi:hypothetical protein